MVNMKDQRIDVKILRNNEDCGDVLVQIEIDHEVLTIPKKDLVSLLNKYDYYNIWGGDGWTRRGFEFIKGYTQPFQVIVVDFIKEVHHSKQLLQNISIC